MISKSLLSGYQEEFQPLADALYNMIAGDQGKHLIQVLKKYQNPDGGFGHGLEADIQMPNSSVAATNLGITLLEQIQDPGKEILMQEAIAYYETVFHKDTLSFEIVPQEVDAFPHAIWWNYNDITSFTYGNPNPEILGTLVKYKKDTSIDLAAFQESVLSYIETELPKSDQFHVLLSVLHLYERGDNQIKDRLNTIVKEACDRLVEQDPMKWDEYVLEPYKVFLTAPSLYGKSQPALDTSIAHLENKLQHGPIRPTWSWYQYEDVFQQIKDHWTILLTYDAIRAVTTYRKQ